MNRLDPLKVGAATALTVGIVSIVCAIAVALFPDGTVNFVNSWTHGLDITVLRTNKPMTLGSLALGLFNVTLFGFLVGALFASCSNLVNRSQG